MISFSDRRKGEELHVLERLQRKVKIAIHYLLFSEFSCSFGRPFASMLPPIFSVNFLSSCWLAVFVNVLLFSGC